MAAKKKAAKKKAVGKAKPTAKSRKPIVAAHPGEGSSKPFVLLWAEKGAADALRKGDYAFSEATQGAGTTIAETPESTGSGNEGADTTF